MADRVDRQQEVVNRWQTRVRCEALGKTLDRAFPADRSACFDEALKAIDEADNEVGRNRHPTAPTSKI